MFRSFAPLGLIAKFTPVPVPGRQTKGAGQGIDCPCYMLDGATDLSAPDFHAVHDDSWLAPVQILTAEELTGNPEPGSISCPSPLYPVYDRFVDQESNSQNDPCINEITLSAGMSTQPDYTVEENILLLLV